MQPPAAMPVLRRTDDHHRDFRPLDAAQGTADYPKSTRKDRIVTRRELPHIRPQALCRGEPRLLLPAGRRVARASPTTTSPVYTASKIRVKPGTNLSPRTAAASTKAPTRSAKI